MSQPQTAPTESNDLDVEWIDEPPATGCGPRTEAPVGGLATYYRLRCLALEATVARLDSELERTDRQRREIIARYEELLQRRECEDEAVFTR